VAVTAAYPKVGQSTNDAEYRELFDMIVGTGARDEGSFKPSGDSSGMKVNVAGGFGAIQGVAWKCSDESVPIAQAPQSGQSRIDTIVANVDYTQSPIVQLEVLTGVATAGTPAAPSLALAGTVVARWPIGDVLVKGGAVTITAADVTDRRTFVGRRIGWWTTATRPPAPRKREMGYNETSGTFEIWDGVIWKDFRSMLNLPIVQQADPGNVPDGTVWISWV
jgi:hypothetical protein